jgi:hypothetical protein
MTLLDVEELTAYWADHPPLHILGAAYLGIGKQKSTRMPWALSDEAPASHGLEAGSDASSLLAKLGRGFVSGDVHAGLSPVVLDFAELRRRATADN